MNYVDLHNLARPGALGNLRTVVNRFGAKNILLVTGAGSYSACGAEEAVATQFSDMHPLRFHRFSTNPKLDEARAGADLAIRSGTDLIVAIGGGSVIDMAKLIKVFSCDPGNAEEYALGKKQFAGSSVPLIAVPTTAGSGSEATHFAVVYMGKDKHSIASQALLPDVAILDGMLLKSNLAYPRAVNGLDALAQAIEGYWASNSSDESQAYSRAAIKLIWNNFESFLQTDEPALLQDFHMAANLAGQSINLSKTTAAHAFSYAFTSNYNIPHGHAVWLTLPKIFAAHATAPPDMLNDRRGISRFRKIMDVLCDLLEVKDPTRCEAHFVSFLQRLGLERSMADLGADTPDNRAKIAEDVNLERLQNNPVRLDDKAISAIFNL